MKQQLALPAPCSPGAYIQFIYGEYPTSGSAWITQPSSTTVEYEPGSPLVRLP